MSQHSRRSGPLDYEAALAATQHRLEQRRQRRLSGINTALIAINFYNDHRDYLIAAELAHALGRDQAEVKQLLAAAGLAGIEVFRLHGTTIREITILPSMETETFIDDSAANALTFVDSAYALLASGRKDQMSDLLSAVDEAGLFSGTPQAIPAWDFGVLLKRMLDSCFGDFKDETPLPSQLAAHASREMAYWQAQLDMLRMLQTNDQDAIEATFVDLSQQLSLYYESFGWVNDPVVQLALPVRGLRVLADIME